MKQIKKIKGYKAFTKNLTCRGMQYEIGEIYEMEDSPICCKQGFHFCKNLSDVYKYYDMSEDTRICEILAIGEIDSADESKYCTNKIKIVREIKSSENKHCNSGNYNSGYCNSGDYNSGYCNSGDYNSGNRNSGDYNSGNYNSGNRNSGDYNSGNYNSGNCNSGNRNSGNYNSGNCNSGDYNSGFCNTTNATVRLFNHQTSLEFNDPKIIKFKNILNTMPNIIFSSYSVFVFEKEMSDEEKAAHPEYKTTGGYTKIIVPENNSRTIMQWWEQVPEKDKEFIRELPYYNEDVFFESIGLKK